MRLAAIALLLLISSCASTKSMSGNGFEIQLNESKPNSSSHASIEIRAIRSDGTPVEGMKITLLDSQLATNTDQLGIAKFSISDALFKDRVKILTAVLPIQLRGYDRVLAIVIN